MTLSSSISFLFVLLALSTTCECCIYKPFSFFKYPNLPAVSYGERRVIYHHDQTIATFDFNYANQIVRCEVTDVSRCQNLQTINQMINYLQPYIFVEIPLDQMLMYMQTCDQFDYDPYYNPFHSFVDENLILLRNSGSFLHGIVPGTKWCGPGDIAQSYHDLGEFRDIDRCCRAHDFCPTKIEANGTRYGLYSSSPITTLDCACDSMFYACLKNINSKGANMVGYAYFNIAQKKCIIDVPSQVLSYNAKMIVPSHPILPLF